MTDRVVLRRLDAVDVADTERVADPGWLIEPTMPQHVTVRCVCGKLQTLAFDAKHHSVDASGIINPSLMMLCCDWHVWARMAGWDGGVRP